MGELSVSDSGGSALAAAGSPGAQAAAERRDLNLSTPREIQVRLRLGDTAAELALISDLSLEQILRFERPIIAERADIIARVKGHQIKGQSGTAQTIDKLVAGRLHARGISPDSVTWAARREAGAPWLVELHFDGEPNRAHFARWTYDHKLNVLTALDDEARWLSLADDPMTPSLLGVPSLFGQKSARRATGATQEADPVANEAAAPGQAGEVTEMPLARTPEPAVSGAPAPLRTAVGAASGLVQSARGGRVGARIAGRRSASGDHTAPGSAGGVAQKGNGTNEVNSDVAAIVALNRWQAGKSETMALPLLEVDNTRPKSGATAQVVVGAGAGAPKAVGGGKAAARKGGRGGNRAQVPTWDEIVFGSKE
ncbi:MAG: DUF3071 domain-containing protein [Cellulomonadaceae bacterium]|nr:DUF3071 domain-containing protein [Cellulomonadaceae bacterium]